MTARRLTVGDRLASRPCTITVTADTIESGGAWCEHHRDEHIVDVDRYEQGRGPWRLVGELDPAVEARRLASLPVGPVAEYRRHLLDTIGRLAAYHQALYLATDQTLATRRNKHGHALEIIGQVLAVLERAKTPSEAAAAGAPITLADLPTWAGGDLAPDEWLARNPLQERHPTR